MIEPSRLGHVRWIGGPPDAGKTTAARTLAERCGLEWYRVDEHEMKHLRRAAEDPERYPHNAATWNSFQTDERAFFESWVTTDPATQAANATAGWIERIGLIADDLVEIDGIVIAEGPAFYPDAVVPLLTEPNHAAWLIPSEAFKRASHARRDKSAWATRTLNPELALANHIARDLILADTYRTRLAAHNLPWMDVNDSTTPDLIVERLIARLGLTRSPGTRNE